MKSQDERKPKNLTGLKCKNKQVQVQTMLAVSQDSKMEPMEGIASTYGCKMRGW